MNLTGFDDQQKQTLLDLLIIGMYADGNLADAEDAKIEAVLAAINFSSESVRDQFIDASFNRARQHLDSPQSTRGFVAEIARHFPTPDIRQKAYDDLEELLSSDNNIVEKESQLLAIVKEEFKL
jgi:uncharacterized tellurite resistance protein B-like protein